MRAKLLALATSNCADLTKDIVKRSTQHLSRTAVTSGGRQYTYQNVLDASDRISSALSKIVSKAPSQSAPPRVGLYAAPGAEYLAGTLAIWHAGGIVVPLATSHPSRELAYVLQDAGISAVITGEEHAPKLADVSTENNAALHIVDPVESSTVSPSGSPLADTAGSSLGLNGHGLVTPSDQGALIIYTSGTTGKTKGVLHTHRSVTAQIKGLVEAWQWSPEDTILHPLPLHHIHGIVNALYCPAYVGAHVSFMPKFSAGQVWQEIMDGKLSVFMGVPTMYSFLLSHYDSMAPEEQHKARQAAGALRLIVSGSSACPVPIMNKWKELTGQFLLERYGMTEVGMALSNSYQGVRLPGAVGTPLPGVSAKIAEDGELLIKGENLFSEYWGREEATREAFTQNGWFKTGDSAETTAVQHEGGSAEYYRILGRTSVDIIKGAGYKISALMIESVILEHPGVAEVAVLGMPDEVYGEVVTALVARRPSHAELGQKDLTSFCRERLAPYQTPKRWRFVEQLPRNAMGKLNKKELLKDLVASEAAAAAAGKQ